MVGFWLQPLLLHSQQYHRTELSVINGLGQGSVTHISEDSLGYIWITQLMGVTRFNGRAFRSYDMDLKDSTALPTREVYHIYHLPDGNAWFSHIKGVSRLNRKENTFTHYSRKDGLHCPVALASFPEGDSILFVTHWYGYDRLDLRTGDVEWIRPFPQVIDSTLRNRSPNLVNNPKVNPYLTREIWSIHNNNLWALDMPARQVRQVTGFELGRNEVLKNYIYLLNYEWVDSTHILLNFHPNQGELFIYNLESGQLTRWDSPEPRNLWLVNIQRIENGQFLCTDLQGGIIRLNLQEHSLVPLDPSLPTETFSSSFIDRQGNIWLGASGYVFRFEQVETVTWNDQHGDFYLGHTADPNTGVVMVYTYGQPLFLRFIHDAFEQIPNPPIPVNSLNTFFHPQSAQFVTIHQGYLYLFHPLKSTYQKVKLKGPSYLENFSDVACKANGFYISSYSNIYFIGLDGSAKEVLAADNDILEIEESGPIIFYVTPGHMYALDTLHKTNTKILDYKNESINCRILATNDKLWIVSRESLDFIEIRDPSLKINHTQIHQQFPDQNFHHLEANHDELLLGTDYRLIILDPVEIRVKRVYSHLDNIHITYWDDICTPFGNYYITTDSRKVIAFPRIVKSPRFISFQAEEILAGGRRYYPGGPQFKLQYHENDIVLRADVVYTGIFDQLSYFYRNTHSTKTWTEAHSETLELLNQRPGKYRIDLKVRDRLGNERIIENAAEFIILPPWYLRIWFFLFAGIMVAMGLFLLYRMRLKRLQVKFEIQSRIQQLEMTALKAQMNPHFVFNCLNSIKGLILIGETEKAVTYIGTFSKLVRSSLDSAEEKLIPLQEELDIAENYLSLERLRYGDRLQWTIRVQEDDLLSKTRVPPFILQPLIENAIIHGIKNIREKGFIHIRAFQDSEGVHLQVIDNGIGLHQTNQKSTSTEHSTRKHLGISLVERRLRNLGGRLTLTDRQDQQPTEQGTISEIILSS